MKKTILQFAKILGFLALGALLLYVAFRGIAMEELFGTLRRANFWWIGLSLFFAGVAFLLRARRWMLLIEPLGYRPGFWNTYHSLMIGYLSNYALPRLGEVTRCVTLGRREKIPVESLIGTVIMERVTDLVMLFLILLVLLVTWMEKFGAFFNEQVFQPLKQKTVDGFGDTQYFWILVTAAILVLFILTFLFRKKLARISLLRKVRELMRGVIEGLKTIYQMKRKWEFIIHSVLIWFFYILMTWVVVFSLEETSGLTFIDGMFLLVIGGLGMAAPVTAGFGAYHWITSRGLVFVYGMPLELGGAYAILTHESNSLFTILLGTFSYAMLMLTRRKSATIVDPVSEPAAGR